MNTITFQQATISSIFQNSLRNIEQITAHALSSKDLREKKIQQWDKGLPIVKLSSSSQGSIKKGLVEAKLGRGKIMTIDEIMEDFE